jgi:modulator of FtsH protease
MSDQNSVLASSVSAQQVSNKVLRNTYALLGITLIPTVIGALIGMSMNYTDCLLPSRPIVIAA